MKVKAIPLVALALVFTPAMADEFSVYKWVDKDGVPHFTDRPPSTATATRTDIRSRRTDPDELMARVERQSEQMGAQTDARREAAEGKQQAAADRRQSREEREAKCREAQERAQTYSTARRLYRPLPDGGREYLTDQELSEARATADAAVNTWCN